MFGDIFKQKHALESKIAKVKQQIIKDGYLDTLKQEEIIIWEQ